MSHKKSQTRILPGSLGLPKTGADSHAHLDSESLWPDVEAVLSRAAGAGLSRIGQVFLGHAAYGDKADVLAARAATVPGAPELFYILGVHPSDGLQVAEGEWAALREDFRKDDRLKAVGEIGLDYHWPDCPPHVQQRVFREQLRLAVEVDRPVVIHSRDAFAPTVAILEEEGFRDRPLLWHCFGGDAAMAETVLAHGWHISVPGPVTYAANQAARDALRVIPDDKLLIETDCPYLAPLPWRGQTNEPALCAFTAEVVAREKKIPVATLWSLCGDNAARFFGLKTCSQAFFSCAL